MILMAPTELRNNLFNTLKTVRDGEMVCIKTRKEKFYIVSEKHLERLTHSFKTAGATEKIKGKIIGSLEEADKALKDYLVLPE